MPMEINTQRGPRHPLILHVREIILRARIPGDHRPVPPWPDYISQTSFCDEKTSASCPHNNESRAGAVLDER